MPRGLGRHVFLFGACVSLPVFFLVLLIFGYPLYDRWGKFPQEYLLQVSVGALHFRTEGVLFSSYSKLDEGEY
jgi:hypothetical protein